MTRPSISAVVVFHDRFDTISRVLEALSRQDHPLERVVVVDNGSEQRLEKAPPYPDVAVLRLEEPVGLAQARNLGLRQVNSDLVLLLDDDVYLAPECLGRLAAASLDTNAAAVCPRIVFHPEDSVVQCDGASIHFAGMLALNHQDKPLREAPSARFTSSAFIGACILIRRQLLVDLGGFDPEYFFYLEDLELSYRLTAQGHAIWCEPRAVVFHDRGPGTPGLSYRGAGRYPPKRAQYTLRHRWLTMLLHYELRTFLLLSPALVGYEMAALVECVRRGWLGQWFQAAWSLAGNLPTIRRRRRRWQHSRRVHDRDILTGGPLPFAPGFAASRGAALAVHVLGIVMEWHWNRIKNWL